MSSEGRASVLAESVRAACIEAAIVAYEDAGVRGLCEEGRFEAALDAVRRLDLSAALASAGGSAVDAPGER